MKINLIVFALIVLIISSPGFAAKYQEIGDCEYFDGLIGRSGLNFICTEKSREHNLFKRFYRGICRKYYYCNDCTNGFFKFMIGTIVFENCDLTQIPSDLFVLYEKVHTFNMSNLGVESLQASKFNEAISLTNLLASHNKITEIPANLFNQSNNLTEADFSFNKINKIDPDAFSAENHLTNFNLSFNNISELSVQTFQKLAELKQLVLSNNQITEIPSLLFYKTDKLIEIDLSCNKIRKIDDFAFSGDLNLKKLNLSRNQLTIFHQKIVDSLLNLTHLDLSENQIGILQPGAFESLQNLAYFDLSGNPIKQVTSKSFEGLVNLQHLNLTRTLLSTIASGAFSTLKNLQSLNLSNNQLKVLNANILPVLANQLKSLSIGNNQLRELNNFTSARIPYAKIAGIDTNKFNCSYFDRIFQSITWKHLDSISKRINCSSSVDHGFDEISTTLRSIEASIPIAQQVILHRKLFKQINSKNQTKINEIQKEKLVMRNETNSRQNNDFTADKEQINSIALEKYILVLIGVMIIGFTTIVAVFACSILRVGIADKSEPETKDDTIYSVEVNAVENHIYDVVDLNTK